MFTVDEALSDILQPGDDRAPFEILVDEYFLENMPKDVMQHGHEVIAQGFKKGGRNTILDKKNTTKSGYVSAINLGQRVSQIEEPDNKSDIEKNRGTLYSTMENEPLNVGSSHIVRRNKESEASKTFNAMLLSRGSTQNQSGRDSPFRKGRTNSNVPGSRGFGKKKSCIAPINEDIEPNGKKYVKDQFQGETSLQGNNAQRLKKSEFGNSLNPSDTPVTNTQGFVELEPVGDDKPPNINVEQINGKDSNAGVTEIKAKNQDEGSWDGSDKE